MRGKKKIAFCHLFGWVRYCGEIFRKSVTMLEHVAKQHSEAAGQIVACSICKHVSPNYVREGCVYLPMPGHVCVNAPRCSDFQVSLRRHFRRNHPDSPFSLDAIYKCDNCPEVRSKQR